MPWKMEEVGVTVDCDMRYCTNNEDRECTANVCEEDLTPDRDSCSYYEFDDNNICGKVFYDIKELMRYVEEAEEVGVHFVCIDPTALRLERIDVRNKNVVHKALVQVCLEDEDKYYYRPSIDGGVLAVNKNQMELIFDGNS